MMKLAVMISGKGSNLKAILEACHSGCLNAKVVLVVSDKSTAGGLEYARRYNIPVLIHSHLPSHTKEEYEQQLGQDILGYAPDWIVLSGWMRLLSRVFLDVFPQRVINLHPALPGAFPGLHAIERAFSAYQEGKIQETGVMVHLVPDEGIDCGPVLKKVTVPIKRKDTLEILQARIQEAEHRLLVETLIQLSREHV